jgi:uncharacterized membrane protein YadS
MFQWLPKAKVARLYLVLIYGVLLPWFALCFIGGSVLKATFISPLALRLQVMDVLWLLCLPPLAGMGIDLSIADWADNYYRPTIQGIGIVVLLIASYFTLLAIMRYHLLGS